MNEPADFRGKPYAAGQTIVCPYLMECSPYLEERTVLAVDGEYIVLALGFGQTRPSYLKHPDRACILIPSIS